jgi:hypothetical protein
VVDAELLNAVVIVLALVVIAGLAVLFVREVHLIAQQRLDQGLGATLRSREARAKGSGTPHEGCFRRGYVVSDPKWGSTDRHHPSHSGLGWLGLGIAIIIVVVGLAVHFSGRCPRCGYIIGFQSPLLLPYRCERCKTPFR